METGGIEPMLNRIKSRIAVLEVAIPVPQAFVERLLEQVRRTGGSFEEAVDFLIRDVSDEDLRRLLEEWEKGCDSSVQSNVGRSEEHASVDGMARKPDEQKALRSS